MAMIREKKVKKDVKSDLHYLKRLDKEMEREVKEKKRIKLEKNKFVSKIQ